ncbi:hypothetical protein ARALYDRAFT_890894 [Arabidopsis lyrata subsp. lyrata]|uniref:Ubiquitin-like protease family profile domain-containing protein n=1 Tax=Arabidopsis lyrata subsp. lyrata TaxID=81972 RepID=D7KIF8_ARALL|nr:hypothetical protein ARALYDRAFT_890894 [Arabidopsis lyrata subsp. lyrata]
MLSAFVPVQVRKKSYARLGVKRISNVPENDDAGDCAIYSIKYIECLALRQSFDGLCDKNMQALRTKLAAKMFDELGEYAGTLNSDIRRKDFPIPQLDDS